MRLGVVLHHEVAFEASSQTYLMKELWGRYIESAFLPLVDSVHVEAPVRVVQPGSPSFQTRVVRNERIWINGDDTSAPRGPSAHVDRSDVARRVFDLVHDSDFLWLYMPCWRSVLAAALCRILRKRYIVYQGGHFVLPGEAGLTVFLRKRAEAATARAAVAVVVAGRRLLGEMRHHQSFVYETVPVLALTEDDIDRRSDVSNPEAPELLYVGNLGGGKRVEDVLLAVRELHARGRACSLTLVGPGDLSAWADRVNALGLDGNVTFHGYVPNGPELRERYRQADVFVLASLSEGFPRVLYEAMAAGLPIVTTPAGGVPDVLADGENAILCGFENPGSIADAVERLAVDCDLRRRMIAANRGFIEGVLREDYTVQVRSLLRRHATRDSERLLVVTNRIVPYRRDLYARLTRSAAHDGWVLATDPASPEAEPMPHTRATGGIMRRLRTLRRVLRGWRPTKVVCGGLSPFTLLARLWTARRGTPCYVWWGGTDLSEQHAGALREVLRAYLLPRIDGFVTYGEESKDFLLHKGVPADSVTVLGNLTVDVEDYADLVAAHRQDRALSLTRIGLDPSLPTVLTVGQLVERKNLGVLVEAVKALNDMPEVPPFQVAVLGGGPERESLRALAVGAPNFILCGELPWEDLARVYAAADVYVHPARLDQWPQAVNEAAMAGLPIVVSHQSGVRGYIEHGVSGLVFDADCPDRLADELHSLLVDPALRARLGAAGTAAARRYGADNSAAVFWKL